LQFEARVVLFVPGGLSSCKPRTVRAVYVRRVFVQFLPVHAWIFQGVKVLLQVVCRTVRVGVPDRPRAGRTVRLGTAECLRGTSCSRTVRGQGVVIHYSGCGTGGSVAFFELSARGYQTVRPVHADRMPRPCGMSA
jgi:hypothetical protein